MTEYHHYGVLDTSLKDILSLVKPTEEDRVKRLDTINDIVTLVQSLESLKGATVKPFGSFISNLYTKWGDLDISVEVSHGSRVSTGRKRKQNLLRDIMRALRRTGVGRNSQFIPLARVPLLIYESSNQNISCDISIDNHLGQIKSKILLWITEIDYRFRDMVLLVKEWAKAHSINDPKSGTLNSYSLCLLVIFHFQTCKPAILPPMKDIYGGNLANDLKGMGSIAERYIEDRCAANIAMFRSQSSGQRNRSSLSQLLISFLEKFSRLETLSSQYAICTSTGQWEYNWSKPQWLEKQYKLVIEDPFEQPDNAARAVGERELIRISNAFAETLQRLSSSDVLLDRNSLLAILVRPNICSPLGVTQQTGYNAYRSHINRPQTRTVGYTSVEPLQDRFRSHINRPQTHTVGYNTSVETLQDRFQNVVRLDRLHPSSSSTVSPRRQGAVDVQSQKKWRPRYS